MEQIEQAVICILDPRTDPNLKAQANAYCEEIKNSNEGWQLCLQLFIKEPKVVPEARFFALQVIDNTLRNRFDTLDNAAVEYLQRSMMEYMCREFVNNTRSEEIFIRNKAAQTITLLFVHVYTTIWPTFFKDIMAIANHENAADFFLRLCLSIDEEIAREGIIRSREQIARNTNIKDTMRLGDVQLLVSFWIKLLQEFKSTNPTMSQLVLKNIGSYVAWIDISLIFNEQVMVLLYELLTVSNLRMAAADCLADIISKGMAFMDKLKMLQLMNTPEILNSLDVTDSDFVESIARLVNAIGVELCKIYADTSLEKEAKLATWNMIEQVIPYLLKFLANESNDASAAVFPFTNDMLTLFKKQKKQNEPFSQHQQEFLGSLLNAVIIKLRYNDDTDWDEDQNEPEEEGLFVEMRKNLRVFVEHISVINEELYVRFVHAFIMDTINKYKAGAELDWRDVELCLYVLHCYGEALPKTSMVFITNNNTVTPLGELISEMVTSNISAYPHPSCSMQYFENLTRYYTYFEHRTDQLPQALSSFVDQHGLHHPHKQIRTRCWYLFQRFVRHLKAKLEPYIQVILTSIGDLLTIEAEPPVQANTMDETPIPTTFDSQVYLFETVGLLISMEGLEPTKQTDYLKIVLEPLVDGIQKAISQPYTDNELSLLEIHHYIMAIGSVARGFPALHKNEDTTQSWIIVYIQATEIIINALQMYYRVALIRDAVRFTFARLITCLGTEVLPYLPNIINYLLTECQVTELIDFLPFIGLIAHKYKPMIEPIMDELLIPLVKRVFDFLGTRPSGTDEAMLLLGLRKSYLNFVMSLFNAGMEKVFVSSRNISQLSNVLQTFLHFAKDNSDAAIQKMAFGVFLKTVMSWASSPGRPVVAGFDQFVYNELIPVTFSVPTSADFNLTDGQSILVFSEMTSIQKTMCIKQGTEYLEYMKNVYLPSIHCPPETAEAYCQAVQQLDLRQFKMYFQKFITEAKS